MSAKEEIQVDEYTDVESRATELACNVPTGFAILPRNFLTAATKKDLLHEDTTPTIRALLTTKGLVETPLEPNGERFSYVEENSCEWVGPIVFIGVAVFTQNPHAISVALGLISNYLADYFKGRVGDKKARFGIVVPVPHSTKCLKLNYDGHIDGIKDLERVIKQVRRNQKPSGGKDERGRAP